MNRHTPLTLTMREPHPLGGRDAAIQVGLTDDGNVAVVLDTRAAQELAQLIARRDPTTPPDAMLEAERDPDDTTWTHVVVDLLATSVMTRLEDFINGTIDSVGQPLNTTIGALARASHPSNGPTLRIVGGAQ